MRKTIDEILEKYDEKDIELAIKLEYGTFTSFAKRVGVSRKMISKYIYEYLLNGIYPAWKRRDSKGSFEAFLYLLKKALKKEERYLEKIAKEENLDKEVVRRIFFRCIEAGKDG